jgi:hypothetical protein
LPASHSSREAALCQFGLIQTREVLTTKVSWSSPWMKPQFLLKNVQEFLTDCMLWSKESLWTKSQH